MESGKSGCVRVFKKKTSRKDSKELKVAAERLCHMLVSLFYAGTNTLDPPVISKHNLAKLER